MWECYKNNIYLLFLPLYMSHVLQPLDIGVFSPLKQAYRKQLGNLSLLTDSILLQIQKAISNQIKQMFRGLPIIAITTMPIR